VYQYRQYNHSLHRCLNLPIRVALFERSISINTLVSMVNRGGIKYTYNGVASFLFNKSTSNLSFTYVSNIYEVLNLPIATPQYLFESFQRWEQIKAFKLDRRNANRIKKGLLPVNSISTRIK